MRASGLPDVEPPGGLDVEHEVELPRLLLGQVPADLDAGRVEQQVDVAAAVAHLAHHRTDGISIGEVDE